METNFPGILVGLDWGQARIGVAACDRQGRLAYPVRTVQAGKHAFGELLTIIAEYEPYCLIVGLPRTLSGEQGIAAQKIRSYVENLAAQIQIPIRLVDERMTTVQAAKLLHQAGKNTRQQRSMIDQQAAVALLDHCIDTVKQTGTLPGEVLSKPSKQAGSTTQDAQEGVC